VTDIIKVLQNRQTVIVDSWLECDQ